MGVQQEKVFLGGAGGEMEMGWVVMMRAKLFGRRRSSKTLP